MSGQVRVRSPQADDAAGGARPRGHRGHGRRRRRSARRRHDERPRRRGRRGRRGRAARARAAELVARAGLPRADRGAAAVIAPDACRAAQDQLDADDARPAARPARPRAALRGADRLARLELARWRSRETSAPARDRQIASIFAGIAGVLVIASEYRFGTIRPTFVFTPQRSRVVGAKLGAAILAGLAFGLVAEALAFGLGSDLPRRPRHRPGARRPRALAAPRRQHPSARRCGPGSASGSGRSSATTSRR